MITYDKQRRVKYKSWISSESFYGGHGDVFVLFLHPNAQDPYASKVENSRLPTWATTP